MRKFLGRFNYDPSYNSMEWKDVLELLEVRVPFEMRYVPKPIIQREYHEGVMKVEELKKYSLDMSSIKKSGGIIQITKTGDDSKPVSMAVRKKLDRDFPKLGKDEVKYVCVSLPTHVDDSKSWADMVEEEEELIKETNNPDAWIDNQETHKKLLAGMSRIYIKFSD